MIRAFIGLVLHLCCMLLPLKGDRNATRNAKGRIPHMAMASKDGLSHSYGVDLPSFAFDFSEYFVSATITRQRYLTMVLMGHRIIYEDYPIEAISTEYEIMEHWNQATKFWAKPVKYNVRAKLQQMYCVVRNHNDRKQQPYHVPATWLRVSSKALNESGIHSNFNRHIEMLRCPLNNLQQGKTYGLDVDVYRKENGPKNGNINSLLISFSVSVDKSYRGYPMIPQFQVSSILPLTIDRRNELYQTFVDRLDSTSTSPLTATSIAESEPTSVSSRSSASLLSSATSTATTPKTVAIIACIPGIRIAHIKRSETGLAMLLEFVAHLFQQGIDQVMLGVVVSTASPYFLTAKLMFQSLYPQDAVILVPTGMADFDDAAGLPGLQLMDNFADVFFLNHCLYLLKGKEFGDVSLNTNGGPKFMLIMRVNQFLLSTAIHTKNPKQQRTLKSILTTALAEKWSLEVQNTASVSGAFLGSAATTSSSSSNNHKDRKSSSRLSINQQKSVSTINKDQSNRKLLEESSKDQKVRPSLGRLCSIRLFSPRKHNNHSDSLESSSFAQYHFIADPMTVFHDNGPGHFTFTKDFFQKSVPRTMSFTSSSLTSHSLFPWMVSLINVDRAIAIDIHSTEELLQQYETSANNNINAKKKNSATFSDLPAAHAVIYPICVPMTGKVAADQIEHGLLTASHMQVNTYVPPTYTSDTLVDLPVRSSSMSGTTLEDVQEQTQQLYQQIHRGLQSTCQRSRKKMINATNLESLISLDWSQQLLKNIQSQQKVTLLLQQVCEKPAHIKELFKTTRDFLLYNRSSSSMQNNDPSTETYKSRKDIIPPFWQLCNTAHLSEILRKVFL